MKINANSLKIGNLITHNNELWTVVKLNHVKPGKGGAFVQTELKNVKDSRKLNDRFRSTENVDRIILDEKKCSYLFQENNNFVFMDLETYEQLEVNSNIVGDQKHFLSDVVFGAAIGISIGKGFKILRKEKTDQRLKDDLEKDFYIHFRWLI